MCRKYSSSKGSGSVILRSLKVWIGPCSLSRKGRPSSILAVEQKTLQDLFLIGLKDIYHAEKALLRSLRKMAKAAESDQLRQAFETHRTETEGQVERLERVFEMVGKRPQGRSG